MESKKQKAKNCLTSEMGSNIIKHNHQFAVAGGEITEIHGVK